MAARLFDHIFYYDFYSKTADEANQEIVLNFSNTEDKFKIQQNDYFQQECLYIVALTCYFLSCKFWERFPPKVNF